jgi:hypothetical protein
MMDAAKYLLQSYFFKICLAVAIISGSVAFSGVLVLALIFYYHFDPLLPLILFAVFWLFMILSVAVCYFLAKQRFDLELLKIETSFNKIRLLFTIFNRVKNLFSK